MPIKKNNEFLIRLADILISLTALVFLSPVLVLLSMILRLTGEGHIFYWQPRVGIEGRTFNLCKFATMLENSPNLGTQTITLKNDDRVLPIGVYLRKWKLNELPQLWNVLIGEMSMVGPRPQPLRCFDAFSSEQKKIIITVKPGITGIAAIFFRAEDSLMDGENANLDFYDNVIASYKGELEVWYIQNASASMYLRILVATVLSVIFPAGNTVWRFFPQIPKPPPLLASKIHNRPS